MEKEKGGREKKREEMMAEKVESWRKGDREERGRKKVDRATHRAR